MKKFYVSLQGGLGFNFAFARLAKRLIEKGYEIKVLSPYWDIFEGAGIPYYKDSEYRDFIFDAKNDDAEIINHRIYDMSDFIYKRLGYKEAWLKLLGLPEDTVSDVEYCHFEMPNKSFTDTHQKVEEIMKAIHEQGYKDYILVQFWGGQSPLAVNQTGGDWSKLQYDYVNEPLKRHYPVDKAQEFVNLYHEKHPDTAIIEYTLPNEPKLENTLQFTVPYHVYYELSKNAKQAITIDSSLQHIISGNCPVTVIWGHSLPENFGYKCNRNIIQKCRRDDILYFTALGASGARIEYIKPEELLFEAEKQLTPPKRNTEDAEVVETKEPEVKSKKKK